MNTSVTSTIKLFSFSNLVVDPTDTARLPDGLGNWGGQLINARSIYCFWRPVVKNDKVVGIRLLLRQMDAPYGSTEVEESETTFVPITHLQTGDFQPVLDARTGFTCFEFGIEERFFGFKRTEVYEACVLADQPAYLVSQTLNMSFNLWFKVRKKGWLNRLWDSFGDPAWDDGFIPHLLLDWVEAQALCVTRAEERPVTATTAA